MESINDLSRHMAPIAQDIEQAISRVVNSGWFVLGPEVNTFENEFASYNGVEHCITVGNGTDALELALRALNIGDRSNVLTVANAGMYSTAAILATGATPVYADIKPDTLLIDITDVICLVEEMKIDAIIITHLYGLMADIHKIIQFAKSKNIPIIEDCAQAHGAVLDGKKAGTFGDMGCFSFYPTKNLGALGDGGAVITNHNDLAKRIKQLRQYGWQSKYHAILSGGRNSRLDEIQAAVLRVKLPLLDRWNYRRREIASQYSKDICQAKIVTPKVYGGEYVAHLYVIKTSDRNNLKQYLTKSGIPNDIHYPIPDYQQSCYKHLFPDISKLVTEQKCAEILTLPCFPEMTDGEVDMVINHINSWQQ